jgi:endonuclease/exonuclease/phosphatase family metal-dependent hydrolase
MQVNVATYNIRGCRGLDRRLHPERIAAIIRKLGMGIVALQEVIKQRHCDDDLIQLHTLAENTGLIPVPGPTLLRPDTPCGTALLTRWPPQAVRHIDLSVAHYEPRGALDVDLIIDNKTVRIICAHLGLRRHERREQIRRLLAAINSHQQDVLVLAGDINEWFPFSQSLKTLRAIFGNQATQLTFPSLLPFLALDRIWVYSSRPYQVNLKKYVSWQARIASDHVPLCAEITAE